MSSPLILSILEKSEKMNSLCKQFSDYADYRELNNTVQLFNDILPPLLVVANTDQAYCAEEVNVVLWNLISMFPNLYAASCSIRTPEYDGTGVTGIVPTSFMLIQKELSNYLRVLTGFVGRKDQSTLKRFSKMLEYHRNAPYRWCFIEDKKCVPILNLRHNVLFEDWVPE